MAVTEPFYPFCEFNELDELEELNELRILHQFNFNNAELETPPPTPTTPRRLLATPADLEEHLASLAIDRDEEPTRSDHAPPQLTVETTSPQERTVDLPPVAPSETYRTDPPPVTFHANSTAAFFSGNTNPRRPLTLENHTRRRFFTI